MLQQNEKLPNSSIFSTDPLLYIVFYLKQFPLILPSSLQDSVKDSISKFMAHVHISVNEVSRLYLSNERRYNYTTPKSFLEQIKLYQSLLLKKDRDLKAKMERLENGLEKLKSTSAQVRTPWGWLSLFFMSGLRENLTGKKFVLDPGSSLV